MLVFGFPISVSRDLRPQVAYPIRLKMNPADYNDDTSLEPGEPWPNCIYEKIPCTNNTRVWWNTENQTSKWTDKWYLAPISRDEINKGYGLNQNPGW